MPNVMIPDILFQALVDYHLKGDDDPQTLETIREGLLRKQNQMIARSAYGDALRSDTTPEARKRLMDVYHHFRD